MLIREMEAKDFNFVIDSWLKSFRTSPWAGVVPNNQYYSLYMGVIEQLIVGGATIYVAEDEDKLLGFICCSVTDDGFGVIHYIYVKKNYRHWDVLPSLLDKVLGITPGFYTFRTHNIYKLLPGWKFAPEIARRKL